MVLWIGGFDMPHLHIIYAGQSDFNGSLCMSVRWSIFHRHTFVVVILYYQSNPKNHVFMFSWSTQVSNFLVMSHLLIYWKEKVTHILFGCYLYQRCTDCVNESLFEMLNIHICTHCDTFLCKKTTCVLHVKGKGDRGYEREIQAVLNNRKNWYVKCPGFR